LLKGIKAIERKPDGSLYKMTDTQQEQAIQQIKKNCPYYSEGNCNLLNDGEGCTCIQSISFSVNCRVFRWLVLDNVEGLSLRNKIFGTFKKDKTLKKCAYCNKNFQPTGNRSKYCPKCTKIVRRKQQSEHIRNKRNKQGSNVDN